ncbi:hypothetical protein GCM10010466_29570 [Planomonospora alba]|uniref:Uncharacterized protein n=1 Tax=Planomonospora alba TaxID=161354 RepID=A0ABP6N556_9ACTN
MKEHIGTVADRVGVDVQAREDGTKVVVFRFVHDDGYGNTHRVVEAVKPDARLSELIDRLCSIEEEFGLIEPREGDE